ncbi:MAG: hypothetical protein IPM95_10855 [Sphingobacteriales bacterium]|nr:hypothetical protein [Sphingobacteriales bacterium]
MKIKLFLIFFVTLVFIIKTFSQSDESVIFTFTESGKVTQSNGKYSVWKNDKRIFKNLKYVEYLVSFIQVLDKRDRIFYIDKDFKKKKEAKFSYGVCGTVPEYVYEIVENKTNYSVVFYTGYDNKKPHLVETDTIDKSGITAINFSNGNSYIRYDGNHSVGKIFPVYPHAIIITKGSQQGIFYDNKLEMFDSVKFIDDLYLV